MRQAKAGYFRSGLPYNRFGHGPRPLVIFQGLMFENNSLRTTPTWCAGWSSIRAPIR